MDVSSVNSTPVSTVLESPQRAPQQAVAASSEAQSSKSEVQPTSETSNRANERVGSQVDVYV